MDDLPTLPGATAPTDQLLAEMAGHLHRLQHDQELRQVLAEQASRHQRLQADDMLEIMQQKLEAAHAPASKRQGTPRRGAGLMRKLQFQLSKLDKLHLFSRRPVPMRVQQIIGDDMGSGFAPDNQRALVRSGKQGG